MLHEFLKANEREILDLTESKTRDLAGNGSSSELLERGLPIFYAQMMEALEFDHEPGTKDSAGMAQAAHEADEPGLAAAAGRRGEVELAKSAGDHGAELMRLGYTLSHVVHAYGAMCQSINELAVTKKVDIAPEDFRKLNQCLDVAIAGAVTAFQRRSDIKTSDREVEHLGTLAHELRNSLNTITMAFTLIKDGTVTPRGSTGQLLERALRRLDELIERSLTEVRLRVDPEIHCESALLLHLVDQIVLTAQIEAASRNQTIEVRVEPTLAIEADQQLMHSALSNLIQNALKYTHSGGKIQVRGNQIGKSVVIEIEDECGGLSPEAEASLFRPFEQHNENRTGLGLGLAIVRRAIALNQGVVECENLPGKGCLFRVTLPIDASFVTREEEKTFDSPRLGSKHGKKPTDPSHAN